MDFDNGTKGEAEMKHKEEEPAMDVDAMASENVNGGDPTEGEHDGYYEDAEEEMDLDDMPVTQEDSWAVIR